MENTITQPETYTQQKKRHQEEFSRFSGLFFAFNNEQFREGLEKLGIEESKAKEMIYSIGAGGYILKSQSPAFHAIFKRHEAERKDLKKDIKIFFDALVYELRNHEYCITYDIKDALEALGLTKEDIDPALLNKACKEAL